MRKIVLGALALVLVLASPVISTAASLDADSRPAWVTELNAKPVSDERAGEIRGSCFWGVTTYYCVVVAVMAYKALLGKVNNSTLDQAKKAIGDLMRKVGEQKWIQYRNRNHGLPAYSQHYG